MANKKVWLTWMPAGEGASRPDPVLAALTSNGFKIGGAHWVDDLEKMAWYELGTTLLEAGNADLWLIAGNRSDLESSRNRYALSLLSAMVREGRGPGFPVFCMGIDFLPDPASLPLLTRDFSFITATNPGWTAKIVTAFMKKPSVVPWDFRLNAICHTYIGQWFEVGPVSGEWQGVMFGASGEGKIVNHMIGTKGQLPEKCVLEYQTKGIKAEVGGTDFIAWSVQNRISSNDSYYMKIEGFPKKVFIGSHPGTDQAEVTVLELY